MITLNEDQTNALVESMAVCRPGNKHLLTGSAGSGKTTVVEHLADRLQKSKVSVVLTAPTHKAVGVLAKKLKLAGIKGVPCQTIHHLLSLKPSFRSDKAEFVRSRYAEPVKENVVVIDEASMLGEDLMRHIRRHLNNAFVLFVGDQAQLNPVGEGASQSFATKSRSHLNTIVRQAEGNPILEAALAIRACQGRDMDWSWMKPARAGKLGVFLPGQNEDAWLQKAFTSEEFKRDPDSFRYMVWTNRRVEQVNRKVRRWIYGDDIPTPFMPGERALFRSPLVVGENVVVNTNEEALVLSIEKDTFHHRFEKLSGADSWTAKMPSWRIELKKDGGDETVVHTVRDESSYNQILARAADEASISGKRWAHYHAFKQLLPRLQAVYALTVHCAQGSTFSNAFVHIPDIKRCANDNLLEMQRLLYVAVTRPSTALMLCGV